MTDAALTALLAAIPATLLALGTLVVSLKTSKKADALATTGDKTHALVNSNMGVQLKLNAAVTKRLAAMTKAAADEAIAVAALTLLKEHDAKQAVVDAKEAANPSPPSPSPGPL